MKVPDIQFPSIVNLNIKRIKGVLLFLAFTGIALALYHEPDRGVARHFALAGISINFVVIGFGVSSIANLITGWLGLKWNPLWFAIFFLYTGMSVLAYLEGSGIPAVPVFIYMLMSGFLLVDYITDTVLEEKYGKRFP